MEEGDFIEIEEKEGALEFCSPDSVAEDSNGTSPLSYSNTYFCLESRACILSLLNEFKFYNLINFL